MAAAAFHQRDYTQVVLGTRLSRPYSVGVGSRVCKALSKRSSTVTASRGCFQD